MAGALQSRRVSKLARPFCRCVKAINLIDEKPRFKRRFIAAVLTLLSCVVYSLPSYSREGTDAGGDTGGSEILPIALLRYHSLDFTRLVHDFALPTTDGTNQLPYYLTRAKGRVVSFYPIVPGLMNVPVYWVADRLGVDLFAHRYQLSAITSAIITALSVGAMFVGLSFVCRRQSTAIFFALVYAFATAAWSVCSRTLWQHGPAILFLSIALAMIVTDKRRCIAVSGFFLIMAVWTRPSTILIVLPIATYVGLKKPRELVPFILGSLPPAIMMCVYSCSYFGSVLNLGQGRNIVADMNGPDAVYGTGWVGLAGVLISPARGLLVFTPVFIFSFIWLVRILRIWKQSGLLPYLAIAVLIYIGFYSQWKIWWGGYCFGYRMLSELVPILILFLADAWQQWVTRQHLLRFGFIVLLVVSVYFQFLGATYYPTNFNNIPDSVNYHPQRLWNVKDTELTRCQRVMLGD
jgi:hypothetical protein